MRRDFLGTQKAMARWESGRVSIHYCLTVLLRHAEKEPAMSTPAMELLRGWELWPGVKPHGPGRGNGAPAPSETVFPSCHTHLETKQL